MPTIFLVKATDYSWMYETGENEYFPIEVAFDDRDKAQQALLDHVEEYSEEDDSVTVTHTDRSTEIDHDESHRVVFEVVEWGVK